MDGWCRCCVHASHVEHRDGYLFLVLPSMMIVVVVHTCRVSLEEEGGGADTRLNFVVCTSFSAYGGAGGAGSVTCRLHHQSLYIFRMF